MEKRLLLTELIAMPDRPPDDAAQHITATFVARRHPVDDEKCTGTDVDRQSRAATLARDVLCAGEFGRGLDQGLNRSIS